MALRGVSIDLLSLCQRLIVVASLRVLQAVRGTKRLLVLIHSSGVRYVHAHLYS